MRVNLDEAGGRAGDHGVGGKGLGDDGICTDDAPLAERDAGHDGNAIAEKAIWTDVDRALALDGLGHDVAGSGIESVVEIGDVHVLAENASVADFYAVGGHDICVPADVDLVSDTDTCVKGHVAVFAHRVEQAMGQYGGFGADMDLFSPPDSSRVLHDCIFAEGSKPQGAFQCQKPLYF